MWRQSPRRSLVEDLAADLADRPYQVARVASGWLLRTRSAYAAAIRAAADVAAQMLSLSEFDSAVLAAIAYHQPISRDGLKDIFGKEISRELIGRLSERGLITTETLLAAFGFESLRDLSDREQLADLGWPSIEGLRVR